MREPTYRVRIRTPDDPDGWTAIGEGPVGEPYVYQSQGIKVELAFSGEARRDAEARVLTALERGDDGHRHDFRPSCSYCHRTALEVAATPPASEP